MKLKSILVIAGLWIAAGVTFAAHPSPVTQLLLLPMGIAYLAAAAAIGLALARAWRVLTWRSAIPLGACLAALPISLAAADATRSILFSHDLPMYMAVVERDDVQRLRPGTALAPLALSESEKGIILYASAERTPDGTLLVELVNGTGFPVKHSGYVYTSRGRSRTGRICRSDGPTERQWKLIGCESPIDLGGDESVPQFAKGRQARLTAFRNATQRSQGLPLLSRAHRLRRHERWASDQCRECAGRPLCSGRRLGRCFDCAGRRHVTRASRDWGTLPLQWASDLKERDRDGERLSIYQRNAYREALERDQTKGVGSHGRRRTAVR